jgi:hypothetical protein
MHSIFIFYLCIKYNQHKSVKCKNALIANAELIGEATGKLERWEVVSCLLAVFRSRATGGKIGEDPIELCSLSF